MDPAGGATPSPSAGRPVDTGALAAALGAVVGERWVADDPEVVAGRTVDWTGRRGPTTAVLVRPGTAAEAAAVLARCSALGVPVVPQGGNTGLVEGSVPGGPGWVVLSTERLAGVTDLDDLAGQVTVGAGTTLAALEAALAATPWRFAVDLAARDTATIGGMVATNAGGVRVVRHGDVRAQLLGVEAACTDGTVLDRRRHVRKDNTGYDVGGLLCGSEGTLAVVTSARLRLVPRPAAAATALVGYPGIAEAVGAGWAIARVAPSVEVVELLGPGCAELVAAHDGASVPDAVAGAGAVLLVEAAGVEVRALAEELGAAVASTRPLGEAVATGAHDAARLWRLRDGVTEVLAPSRPLKLDVSLPARALARYCGEVEATVGATDRDARTFVFGHVGDHNVHVNVVGLTDDQATRVEATLLSRAVELGGSPSGEHGIGRRRLGVLEATRPAPELARFAAIKRAWDPAGILNPGVIVPAGGPG